MSASAAPAPAFPFFGGHRWVFWPIALIPAATVLLSDHCMKNGSWPAPLLLTFMVMACLWEAHVQTIRMEQPGRRMLWQVCKRAFRTLRSVAIAGLLFFVPIGILLPSYACYSDRARVSEAILRVSEPQQEIAYRASVNKTLKGTGVGLQFPQQQGRYPSNGFILENGVIALVMAEPPAAVLFTPKLVDAHSGAIEWSCRGYPAKSVPAKCREPK